MEKSTKWDLVIVGGGAGGLVLALTLAKQGMRIALLDRAPRHHPLSRGEIIQPNGLGILDRLGLLPALLEADVYRNERVVFYQTTGPRLCTIDYRVLPSPYDYSLIVLPKVVQQVFLDEITRAPNITLLWGAAFQGFLYERGKRVGVEADCRGERLQLFAPMVVGGDGVRSPLRAAIEIPHWVDPYLDGYLTAVVDRSGRFEGDSSYFLGRRMIFGAFPVSDEKLYLFYMIPSPDLEKVRGGGIDAFKKKLLSLHPSIPDFLEKPLQAIVSWEEVSYMPCFRVRCERWVDEGAALIGDAAHAMNPHVAQGRNAAMEDGVVLAEVLEGCFKKGDFSRKALSEYEARRRPSIEHLQRLGDELTWLWNSGFPPLVSARNRVFRSIDLKRDLHDKIVGTIAGIKRTPFNLLDRWRALHLWGALPDRTRPPV